MTLCPFLEICLLDFSDINVEEDEYSTIVYLCLCLCKKLIFIWYADKCDQISPKMSIVYSSQNQLRKFFKFYVSKQKKMKRIVIMCFVFLKNLASLKLWQSKVKWASKILFYFFLEICFLWFLFFSLNLFIRSFYDNVYKVMIISTKSILKSIADWF